MQDRTTVLAIKVHHSLGLAFYMCLVLCTFATKPICRRCWGRTQSLSQPRDLPDWRVDWGRHQICMSLPKQFNLTSFFAISLGSHGQWRTSTKTKLWRGCYYICISHRRTSLSEFEVVYMQKWTSFASFGKRRTQTQVSRRLVARWRSFGGCWRGPQTEK